ncbi:hypothetical protein BV25DRAFT_1828873 [Artomyces pyxidatus]|uniref:Uncharacterized protein n=1 Tax=Artomyces pyxidatus TaxID=48021 RepID=A0ACB8SUJ2_9AGAM|nr:hypothetical protein BV25DRAFT_1828873 [Artomyces pyxidatus]
MCVGFWSLTHPDYALILCTNRDEYLARPTADAHFHSFENLDSTEERHPGAGSVLSGRDLLAGGTWFGLSRAGRLALLTNVTEPPATYASSRGHLLTSVLLAPTAGRDLERETEVLLRENEHTSYAGFNLLLLAPAVNPPDGKLAFDANFVTNSGGGGTLHSRALSGPERNCSGMSNGIDGHGADAWPKVVHGTAVLNSLLPAISPETTEEELAERLFALLTWVFLSSFIRTPPPASRPGILPCCSHACVPRANLADHTRWLVPFLTFFVAGDLRIRPEIAPS